MEYTWYALGLADRNVGRLALTMFFKVMFRVMYGAPFVGISETNKAPPLQCTTPTPRRHHPYRVIAHHVLKKSCTDIVEVACTPTLHDSRETHTSQRREPTDPAASAVEAQPFSPEPSAHPPAPYNTRQTTDNTPLGWCHASHPQA